MIDNTWSNHKQHQYGATRTSRGISQLQIPMPGCLKSLFVQGSEDLSPVCFGVQPLPSCVGSLELSWEFLSPETRFGGCSLEWHSFVVLNRYLRSPRGSQVYPVLFCFLPWLDLWVVNPGVMSWYLDCCGVESITEQGFSMWAGVEPLGTHLSRL